MNKPEQYTTDHNRGELFISVRNAAVVYNQKRSIFKLRKFEALKDVSLDIHAGESVGVIGRNGAGKSTFLRLLAGIIKPDRGTVINTGVKVSLLALQVGFAPELSGRDNIMLSGMLLGFSKDAILENMDAIIEFSGLQSHIDVAVRTYSTGMSARLGFSIAHQLHPDVLLIDETLGVGDKAFQIKSSKAMKEKIKSNQTVVLVSHNAQTIAELCDRAIWIEDGVAFAKGLVDEVLWLYNNAAKLEATRKMGKNRDIQK